MIDIALKYSPEEDRIMKLLLVERKGEEKQI